MGAPMKPYGISNWGPGSDWLAPARLRALLPASPWVTSATSQYPALMAAIACAMCMMNDEPPTAVVSVYLGSIPRYSASVRVEKPAVSRPSTSLIESPASSSAL